MCMCHIQHQSKDDGFIKINYINKKSNLHKFIYELCIRAVYKSDYLVINWNRNLMAQVSDIFGYISSNL